MAFDNEENMQDGGAFTYHTMVHKLFSEELGELTDDLYIGNLKKRVSP